MNGDNNNNEFGPPRDPAWKYPNSPPIVPATAPHPHPEVTGSVGDWANSRPTVQRRKSSTRVILVVLLIGVAVVLLCGLGSIAILASSQEAEPFVVPSATHYADKSAAKPELVLTVEGTGTADISYNVNGTGGSVTDATLPWRRTVGPFQGYTIVSLVAQDKTGSATQKIVGKIGFGPKVYACEATGAYAVAMCTGSNQ
jgi:hypothetical protein